MTKKEIKNYLLEDYLFNLDQASEWFRSWKHSNEELHSSTHRIYKSYYAKAEHGLDMLKELKLITDDEWDLYWNIMQNSIHNI